MDFKDRIKICLILSFDGKIDGIDGRCYYTNSSPATLEECLIVPQDDKAINLKNGAIYEILEKSANGGLLEDVSFDKCYVYQILDYEEVFIHGKVFIKPEYSIEDANELANEVYNNYKKMIPFNKNHIKKKTKRK